MNKKLISLVLCVLLVLTCANAFAAVPSKTTQDMASVKDVASSTYVGEVKATFSLTDGNVQATSDELDKIADYVAMGGVSTVSYFGTEVVDAIAQLLPEVDLDNLELNEIAPLTVADYDEAYGDLAITFSFATVYAQDQAVVALIGIESAETQEIVWTPAEAEVQMDGSVQVVLPQALLVELAAAQNSMITILSEAAA